MREERARVPQEVHPAEGRRGLRPGRLAATPAPVPQPGEDGEAPLGLQESDRAADRLVRRARCAPALRRNAFARGGPQPHSCHTGNAGARGGAVIHRKTPQEIEKMAAAGRILARCHEILRRKARPGVTTAEIDETAERFIRSQNAEPAFKGYRGFPGSICASPNSMVVHGIPGSYRLNRGDILSVDIGVIYAGWVADAAITHPIGNVTPIAKRLLASTRAALFDAVEQCRPGNRLGDVSHAVQARVEADGFAVIRSLVGHGIGREMHEDPQIPNFGEPGTGPELEEGM